ncbi:hypothetical protein AAC387_Pa06g0352 [Persea americana]
MGNCITKKNNLIQANETHQHQPTHDPKERTNQQSSVVRIKVRMRMEELRELISQADVKKGGEAEIGHLIMQQCSRGKCHAAIADDGQQDFPRDVKRLETIKEI